MAIQARQGSSRVWPHAVDGAAGTASARWTSAPNALFHVLRPSGRVHASKHKTKRYPRSQGRRCEVAGAPASRRTKESGLELLQHTTLTSLCAAEGAGLVHLRGVASSSSFSWHAYRVPSVPGRKRSDAQRGKPPAILDAGVGIARVYACVALHARSPKARPTNKPFPPSSDRQARRSTEQKAETARHAGGTASSLLSRAAVASCSKGGVVDDSRHTGHAVSLAPLAHICLAPPRDNNRADPPPWFHPRKSRRQKKFPYSEMLLTLGAREGGRHLLPRLFHPAAVRHLVSLKVR